MSRLRVAPIVEGHGEVESIRILLRRIWSELFAGDFIDVLPPIRVPKTRLVRSGELERAVRLAAAKLRNPFRSEAPQLMLLLIDADDDPPCALGPALQRRSENAAGGIAVSCVVANVEFETWFVAAAESLGDYLDISDCPVSPTTPETQHLRKGWIEHRFKEAQYRPTINQPAMTARMDLRLCRARSPSFDKLCREIGKRLSSRVTS